MLICGTETEGEKIQTHRYTKLLAGLLCLIGSSHLTTIQNCNGAEWLPQLVLEIIVAVATPLQSHVEILNIWQPVHIYEDMCLCPPSMLFGCAALLLPPTPAASSWALPSSSSHCWQATSSWGGREHQRAARIEVTEGRQKSRNREEIGGKESWSRAQCSLTREAWSLSNTCNQNYRNWWCFA